LSSNLSEYSASDLPVDLQVGLNRVGERIGLFAGRVRYLAAVSSTNEIAAALAAAGADEGTTIVADTQSCGRGRRGRVWSSPPGAGLYVSIVARPRLPGDLLSVFTLAAAVALAEAVRISTTLAVEIKWPNDLVVGRRKLGGILAEGAGQVPQYVILGFGINVRSGGHPADVASRATSIESELGKTIDRGALLGECLARLAERYADLLGGRFDAILSCWRTLAPSSVGSAVEWDTADCVKRGTTAGINHRGALLVRVGDAIEPIIGGEVRWIEFSG
jgi:BirA family biotin operon repressor/biotin-[acetyl-CoA-carboxylase] ligase